MRYHWHYQYHHQTNISSFVHFCLIKSDIILDQLILKLNLKHENKVSYLNEFAISHANVNLKHNHICTNKIKNRNSKDPNLPIIVHHSDRTLKIIGYTHSQFVCYSYIVIVILIIWILIFKYYLDTHSYRYLCSHWIKSYTVWVTR